MSRVECDVSSGAVTAQTVHRGVARPLARVKRPPAGAIELVGLEKRFGEFVAVDGIDLSIGAGEFFSLLGPSGCGKTTTLRLSPGSSSRPRARSCSTVSTSRDAAAPAARSTRSSRATRCSRTSPSRTTSPTACGGSGGVDQGRAGAPGRRRDRAGAARRAGATQARAALRRAAATGRAGPGARARADGAPARRAARRARRQAAQGAAARAHVAADATSASRSSTSPTTRRRR